MICSNSAPPSRAEVWQRLGTERAVDLDTGDPALRPHAVGHQPHHRAWAGADVEAAHAWAKPDGGKHMRRGLLPHAGLIAQTLIFFGVARMDIAVGIGFARLLP